MSRVSGKNQVTVPVEQLRAAGVAAGDEVHIKAAGPGVIVIETVDAIIDRFAGVFDSEVYPEGYLDRLRDEWEW